MPFFRKKTPAISRPEALAVKPLQLVEATPEELPDGGVRLKVRLKETRATKWIFKLPQGATKAFELDALGRLVWEACDGKTSVQQIIRRLAREYDLNLREAEVPTVRFLHMLVKKGLVGMPVKKQ